VDVLAGEGSAPAVGAAMPISLQRTDAAAKENALELLDMAFGGGHGLKDSSSQAGFLPFWTAERWVGAESARMAEYLREQR
jgi:hypothetical protein